MFLHCCLYNAVYPSSTSHHLNLFFPLFPFLRHTFTDIYSNVYNIIILPLLSRLTVKYSMAPSASIFLAFALFFISCHIPAEARFFGLPRVPRSPRSPGPPVGPVHPVKPIGQPIRPVQPVQPVQPVRPPGLKPGLADLADIIGATNDATDLVGKLKPSQQPKAAPNCSYIACSNACRRDSLMSGHCHQRYPCCGRWGL